MFRSGRSSLYLMYYGQDRKVSPALATYNLTSSLPTGTSFARSSIGAYYDSTPLLVTAAVDEERFDHDPVTGVARGILLERQSTNLAYPSVPGSVWQAQGVIFQGTTTAPSGNDTARVVENGVSTNPHITFTSSNVSYIISSLYAFSVYAKKGTQRYLQITGTGAAFGSSQYANFDLQDGVLGSISGVEDTYIEDVGNGWYRCVAVIQASASASATRFIAAFIPSATSTRVPTYTGGSETLYLWNAQTEKLTSSTSAIQTSGSEVTRFEDQLTIDIPLGGAIARLTFDDNSTQDLFVTAFAGSTYTIDLTILNRPHVKKIDVLAADTQYKNIASAMRVPGFSTGSLSNGTDTAHNSMRLAVNESGVSIPSVKIVYSGWNTNTNALGVEQDINGDLTITASVEYPIGVTRNQITWGGSPTGTVVSGENYVSDEITLITPIPAGEKFFVRTFITAPSSTKWPIIDLNSTGTYAEKSDTGLLASITDKTMIGSPTGTGRGYGPSAVISKTSGMKSICFASIGDSIATGAGDGNFDSNNNTSIIGRASTGVCPIVQMGVTGTTAQAQTVAGMLSRRIDLMVKSGITHALVEYGSNDLSSGRTPSQLRGDIETISNLISVQGIKVIGWTVLPRLTSSSADSFETTTYQTPLGGNFVAGSGSGRHTYNGYVRSLFGSLVDYFEASNIIDVNTSNILTSGGGYMLVGPSTYQDQAYTGSCTGTPTTTIIPTTIIKATNYFANYSKGYVLFTSGINNGVLAAISSNDASGTITLSSPLASAPSSGDTIILQSNRMSSTSDGTHPNVTDTSAPFGGVYSIAEQLALKLTSYL